MDIKKAICVIFYTDSRYEKLAQVAYRSFKAHHDEKEVECILVNAANLPLEWIDFLSRTPAGIARYHIALNLAIGKKATKLIILGADTITCARLGEFLDNDEDIIATLDYPYQFSQEGISSPDSETHINADVVCFNNLNALAEVINAAFSHNIYFEQGGLNQIAWAKDRKYSLLIADYPYEISTCVYNARAKGNLIAESGTKPWGEFTRKFHVKDGRLYTGLHKNNQRVDKQIKVWHYCEGFGTLSATEVDKILNWWKTTGFNQETKNFFEQHCDAGDFFK